MLINSLLEAELKTRVSLFSDREPKNRFIMRKINLVK